MEKFRGWLIFVIHVKTFAIVQQFETPYNKRQKFAGKPSRLEANPRKPRKFPPRTICIIRYFKTNVNYNISTYILIFTSHQLFLVSLAQNILIIDMYNRQGNIFSHLIDREEQHLSVSNVPLVDLKVSSWPRRNL